LVATAGDATKASVARLRIDDGIVKKKYAERTCGLRAISVVE
jgi:hypothetical protein